MKRVLNILARRKTLIKSVALVVLSRITEVENVNGLIWLGIIKNEKNIDKNLLIYLPPNSPIIIFTRSTNNHSCKGSRWWYFKSTLLRNYKMNTYIVIIFVVIIFVVWITWGIKQLAKGARKDKEWNLNIEGGFSGRRRYYLYGWQEGIVGGILN